MYLSIKRARKQIVVIMQVPLLSTYKILSNILLSRLTTDAEEIIGDHQGGFQHNMSTTVHIFCTHQIPEKNGNTMKQCISYFTDFKKAYDSGRREVLYNILIRVWYTLGTFKANKNV